MKLRHEHRKWSILRRERKTVAIEWKRNASDLCPSLSLEHGKRDFSHFFGKYSINERVIQLTGLVRNRTLSSSLLSEELLNIFALSSITLSEKISFFFVFSFTSAYQTNDGVLWDYVGGFCYFVRFLPVWITTMTRCVRRAASIDDDVVFVVIEREFLKRSTGVRARYSKRFVIDPLREENDRQIEQQRMTSMF